MEDNIFNGIHKETITQKAKEKLQNISIEEKNNYAKKECTTNIMCAILSLLILLPVGIFLIAYDTDYTANIGGLIGGLFLLLIGIGVCIYFIFNCKRPTDELALKAIKKELQDPQIGTKSFLSDDFVSSKEVSVLSTGWSSCKLLIDNKNKKFVYQKGSMLSKTFAFSDIINYEVYENGQSKVQGRAGSALIGGAFFGLGGLIVGASMSRNINEKCSQLKIIIRLKDLNCPQIVIDYLDGIEFDKSSLTYRTKLENLQLVCSTLEYMINEKSLEQSTLTNKAPKENNLKTNKEQLKELKEMLDDGLITQEDFEQKKKQILGL